MLIIYFKSDGEIHQVAPGYLNLEEFYGIRAEEFKLIFDCIFIDEVDYFVFNNFINFKVDINTKELVYIADKKYKVMFKK